MFIRVDKKFVDEYLKDDYLLREMQDNKHSISNEILESREFRNMEGHTWKRAMFHEIYSDLVGQRILDVGGAYCGHRKMIEENDYTLLDPNGYFKTKGVTLIKDTFQHHVPDAQYDYVICCDVLLSNSDKLELFLEKYLPICKELRFSLTFRYHNSGLYAGFSINDLNMIMTEYGVKQKRNTQIKKMFYRDEGLANSRNVYLISLKGDL
jgi:hypothetical protein